LEIIKDSFKEKHCLAETKAKNLASKKHSKTQRGKNASKEGN